MQPLLGPLVGAVRLALGDPAPPRVEQVLGACLDAHNAEDATLAARALVRALRSDGSPAAIRAQALLERAVSKEPSRARRAS